MGSCAESCGLTKKLKKNEGYFDLDCKLMKEEAKYLLNRLNEFDSAEDQSLKLANYKDKRREYKSLIKRKKKSTSIRRNWISLMILEIKILKSFGAI